MDQNRRMETIRVVLEGDLLWRVDKAARRLRLNRSALIRQALREYLKQLELRRLEAADRHGYQRNPEDANALRAWDRMASSPND